MKLQWPDLQQIPIVRLINTPRNKYLVYMFLHVPKTWIGIAYQIFMWMLIATCILVTMFMQINVGSVTEYVVLFWLDLSCLIIFTCEFVLNVWASTVLPRYSGPYGVLWMLINPLYMLDMAVIGLTIADVALDCLWMPLAAGLRGFRLIHFFQYRYVMVRLLWKAIWSERFQVLVTLYYCIVWVFTFGFLMYFIEQPFNEYFNTVANSVWWAVVTFTTVGYGNAAPITIAGKIVTAFAMISGVWLFGLPAGVVGAALALKCEEECSMAGTLRQNFGAAMVQMAWKIYRIRKQEDRRQEDDPPLLARINPRDGRLEFWMAPNPPPPEVGPFYNPIAVKAVFMLKHLFYKRKFIMAEEINDSKNFYATYMQTSWQQTNLLLDMQNKLDHLSDSVRAARANLTDSLGGDREIRSIGDADGPPPPPPPAATVPPPATTTETTSTISSGTTVPTSMPVASTSISSSFEKDSPLVLLARRRIPVHRLLRRQIRCWKCLQQRYHQRRQHRNRNQSFAVPPLLLDLSSPRPSHSSLLL